MALSRALASLAGRRDAGGRRLGRAYFSSPSAQTVGGHMFGRRSKFRLLHRDIEQPRSNDRPKTTIFEEKFEIYDISSRILSAMKYERREIRGRAARRENFLGRPSVFAISHG